MEIVFKCGMCNKWKFFTKSYKDTLYVKICGKCQNKINERIHGALQSENDMLYPLK